MESEPSDIEPIPMELSDADRAFLEFHVLLQKAAASGCGIEFSMLVNPIIEVKSFLPGD